MINELLASDGDESARYDIDVHDGKQSQSGNE